MTIPYLYGNLIFHLLLMGMAYFHKIIDKYLSIHYDKCTGSCRISAHQITAYHISLLGGMCVSHIQTVSVSFSDRY